MDKESNSFLFYLMVLILFVGFILSFVLPAKAENKRFVGLLCDEQAQITNWLTLWKGGMTQEEALEQINTAANNPIACAVVDVIVSKIEVEKELILNGENALIYKLLVVAAVTPFGPQPIEPAIQYGAGKAPKQDTKM